MIKIETEFYLIVNDSGRVRTSIRTPSLKAYEVSIKMVLAVPDAIFQRPMLQARIEIPTNVVNPNPIDGEVVSNVEDAIRQATGLDFSVRLIDYEDARRIEEDG